MTAGMNTSRGPGCPSGKKTKSKRTPRKASKRRPPGKKSGNVISKSDVMSSPQASCAVNFLKAILGDPTKPVGEVCNFGSGSANCLRTTTTGRFEISQSAGFTGLVAVRPSPWNDQPSLYHYSSATPASLTFTTALTGTSHTLAGGMFAQASGAEGQSGIEFRLLGGSIKVEPTTAPLYRAGSMVSYLNQDQFDIVGATTVPDIQGYLRSRYAPIGGGKSKLMLPYATSTGVHYSADEPWEHGAYAFARGALVLPPATGGISSYLIRCRFFWELRGRTVASISTTPKTVDENLFGKVENVLKDIIYDPNSSFENPSELLKNAMIKIGPEIASSILNHKAGEDATLTNTVLNYLRLLTFDGH